MKRKVLIAGVAGFVILGGAIGANAMSSDASLKTAATPKTSEKAKLISMEQAIEIAINKVGGKLESIELDKDDDRLIYEIELDAKGKYNDIDVDVDAVTGEIIKIDKDQSDDDLVGDDDKHQNVNKGVNISRDEAVAIATKDTPGKVTDVDFDSDDTYYEIEIQKDEIRSRN